MPPFRILFTDTIDLTAEVENRYPPLGPGYLCAYLITHDPDTAYEFRYVPSLTEDQLNSFNPDIVAITSVSQNYERAKEYARLAKRHNKIVIAGGIHISSLPSTLSDAMDIGIIGEGEQTFFEVIRSLSKDRTFNKSEIGKIQGICFHENDPVRISDKRELIDEKDIPHPLRSLTGYREHDYIFSSRGCPYRCRFCASSRYWKKIRWLSAEFVVEEIRELIQNGVKMISFYDDLFIANKPRLEQISRLIEEEGINKKVKFTCSARANLIDETTIACMKRMNIVSVGLGLESGNQRVLNYLKGDNVTVEDNLNAVQLLNQAGIQANASFIIGSPDETVDEMLDTYNFIKNNPLSFADVYILTPYPGTPIWDYAKERGFVSDSMDWNILNINFEKNKQSAIILSETVNRETIIKIYNKFRRLRLMKIILALPRSPWLRDVPKMVAFYTISWFRRMFA